MQAIFAGKAQSSQNKSCPKKRNRNQKPCFLAAERVSTHPPFSSLQILGSILSRAGARPLPSPASFLPSWPRMRQHVIYSPPGVHFSFFYCDLLLVCWAQLLSFRKGLWKGSGPNYRKAPSCLFSPVLVPQVGQQSDAWSATFQPHPPNTCGGVYQSWAAVANFSQD